MKTAGIKVLTVQMPDQLYDNLNAAAHETGNSMASVVRQLIAQALNPKKPAQAS